MRIGLGLALGAQRRATPPATVTLMGLTDGEARPGDHATISAPTPEGVTWLSQTWGVGTYGDTTYGTGTNPPDFTASYGMTLLWQGEGSDGNIYRGAAPIFYAAPVALQESDIIEVQAGSTDLIQLSTYFAAFGGTAAFSLFRDTVHGFVFNTETGALDISASGITTSINGVRLADANAPERFDELDLEIRVQGINVTTTGGEVSIDDITGNITITISSGIYAGTYTADIGGNTLTETLVTTNRFVCFARPQISGDTGLGDTLTGTNGLWLYDSAFAEPAFSSQWQNEGVNITDATGETYVITAGDQGDGLEIDVTASEGADSVTASSLVTEVPASGVWGAPVVNSVGDGSVNLTEGANAPAAPGIPTINSVGDGSVNISAAA